MKELVTCDDGKTRCSYRIDDPFFTAYHDTQFGRPTDDDRLIFRKIAIEVFASGLSFHGVLAKMEAFDDAFSDFDIDTVAAMTDVDVERLMGNADLIRNERKIRAVISNAACARAIAKEAGSFAAFVWQFEPDPETRPDIVTYETVQQNTQSKASKDLAAALKKRGMKFVGPVSMYGVLQGCGLINDHFHGCDFRDICEEERARFKVPQ